MFGSLRGDLAPSQERKMAKGTQITGPPKSAIVEDPVSTIEWLKIHGVDAQRLSLHHWLPALGFLHCQGI